MVHCYSANDLFVFSFFAIHVERAALSIPVWRTYLSIALYQAAAAAAPAAAHLTSSSSSTYHEASSYTNGRLLWRFAKGIESFDQSLKAAAAFGTLRLVICDGSKEVP